MHLDRGGRPYSLEDAQRCVGPGWASLVAECYNALPPGSEVTQVKEKYGGLRFYCQPNTTDHATQTAAWDAIHAIEERSLTVCENCGKPGSPRGRQWIRTLCDDCGASC